MTAIGMGLAFAAYAGILWGYCLIRDYNVTFAQLWASAWPGAGRGKGTVSSQVVPTPSGRPAAAPYIITGP